MGRQPRHVSQRGGCQINRLIRRLLWVETLDAAPCDWSVAEEAAIRQEIAHRTILQPPPRLRQTTLWPLSVSSQPAFTPRATIFSVMTQF